MLASQHSGEDFLIALLSGVVDQLDDVWEWTSVELTRNSLAGLLRECPPILLLIVVRPQAVILGYRHNDRLWLSAAFDNDRFAALGHTPKDVAEMDTGLSGANGPRHLKLLSSID
jgi:hypothetical protein